MYSSGIPKKPERGQEMNNRKNVKNNPVIIAIITFGFHIYVFVCLSVYILHTFLRITLIFSFKSIFFRENWIKVFSYFYRFKHACICSWFHFISIQKISLASGSGFKCELKSSFKCELKISTSIFYLHIA